MTDSRENKDQAVVRLKASLARTYSLELGRAEYYRAYRAELATKLRIGLVGLNGASALGLATVYGALNSASMAMAGLKPPAFLGAFVCYMVGAWLAGWALSAQYNDAIKAEGDAGTRAITTGIALDWVDAPSETPARGSVGQAFGTLRETPWIRAKHDQFAIYLHSASWGLWAAGTMTLAVAIASKVAGLKPAWPALSRMMGL